MSEPNRKAPDWSMMNLFMSGYDFAFPPVEGVNPPGEPVTHVSHDMPQDVRDWLTANWIKVNRALADETYLPEKHRLQVLSIAYYTLLNDATEDTAAVSEPSDK